MTPGPLQLIIIGLIILVLFGRGKISEMMGDFGKGIKSFKQGMNDEEKAETKPAQQIQAPTQDAGSDAQNQTKPTAQTTDSTK